MDIEKHSHRYMEETRLTINRKRVETMRKRHLRTIITSFLCVAVGFALALATGVLRTSWTSSKLPGDVEHIILVQDDVTGTIVPGQSMDVNPVVVNGSSKEYLAFVKVTVPVYGSSSPAYTYTASSDWTLVEDGGAVKVYGFNDVLGTNDQTSALMDGMTMVNMDVSEFKAMSDVNVSLEAFLSPCDQYGEDPQTAWNTIGK